MRISTGEGGEGLSDGGEGLEVSRLLLRLAEEEQEQDEISPEEQARRLRAFSRVLLEMFPPK